MRIIIDMDGVVCDTMPYWMNKIYLETGVKATLDDIKTWQITDCPPLDTVDPRIIFGLLNEPQFTINIPIMPGAQEVLRNLKEEGHDLYLVTARHGAVAMSETLTWIRTHLPFIPVDKRVIFAYDKWLIKGDLIIDDKADNLIQYVKHNESSYAIGIRYEYNKHAHHDRIGFVDYGLEAWPEIQALIEDL